MAAPALLVNATPPVLPGAGPTWVADPVSCVAALETERSCTPLVLWAPTVEKLAADLGGGIVGFLARPFDVNNCMGVESAAFVPEIGFAPEVPAAG
jgi:hypothetical protein